MKITLIHISDLHWLPKKNATDTEKKKSFNNFVNDLMEYDFTKFQEGIILLVFTGDIADFYKNKNIPLGEQLLEAKEHLLKKLTQKFKHDYKFIIPGNHDISRDAEQEIDRTTDFRELFNEDSGWITPYTNSIFSLPQDMGNIVVWPINSSAQFTNDSSIAAVTESAKKECEKLLDAENDMIRIALIHHNPLPQKSHEGGGKDDHFLHNGDFNDFLLKNNFSFILSGHYHQGSALYLSNPSLTAHSELKQGSVSSGLISIGARSLLRYDGSETRGLNILNINIDDSGNTAEVKFNEFNYLQSGGIPADNFKFETREFDISLKPLEKIFPEKSDFIRRNTLLKTIKKEIYSPKFPIALLESKVGIKNKNSPISLLSNYISEANSAPSVNNVRRMSAISTLHPATWWANNLFETYRSSFLSYYSKARVLGMERRESSDMAAICHFNFSDPIRDAIDASLKKSTVFKVTKRYHPSDTSLPFESKMFLDRAIYSGINSERLNTGNSISIWDNTEEAPITGSHQKTNILTGDLSVTLGPKTGDYIFDRYPPNSDRLKQLKEKIEIFRILLWPPHWLETEYAVKIISFHESLAVPLFWLDPQLLVGRDGKLVRKNVGWTSICASMDKNGIELHAAKTFFNDRHALSLEQTNDLWCKYDGDQQTVSDCIWGKDNGPRSFYGSSANCHEEAEALLCHPDIVLAADAWAMRQLGEETWREFRAINYPDDRISQVLGWARNE